MLPFCYELQFSIPLPGFGFIIREKVLLLAGQINVNKWGGIGGNTQILLVTSTRYYVASSTGIRIENKEKWHNQETNLKVIQSAETEMGKETSAISGLY